MFYVNAVFLFSSAFICSFIPPKLRFPPAVAIFSAEQDENQYPVSKSQDYSDYGQNQVNSKKSSAQLSAKQACQESHRDKAERCYTERLN